MRIVFFPCTLRTCTICTNAPRTLHHAPSHTTHTHTCTYALAHTSTAPLHHFAPTATCTIQLALADMADSSVTGSGSGEPAGDMPSPKRQYFIAPRIGRSGGGNGAAIWSALEEGAFNVAGQIQPHRGFPGPLRSSLLFLINGPHSARRYIGPRSSGSGLLPQARIGRRASGSPVGLMPAPRVGRRSMDTSQQQQLIELDTDGASDAGQQEVAMATLSDSSLSDAIESIINA